jgi:hypothetical protein
MPSANSGADKALEHRPAESRSQNRLAGERPSAEDVGMTLGRAAITPLLPLQPKLTTTSVRQRATADLALTHRRWHLSLLEHGGRTEIGGLARWSRSKGKTDCGASSSTTR